MRGEKWIYTVPLRARALFRRAKADAELDEELREHMAQKTEEYVARGMTAEEARRAAMIEMGGVEQTKEKCRDARRVGWIQDLLQDLRFGARMLRKSPGFMIVAVLTLALGIGANTTIFSAVNGIMFDPLPYPNASRLIRIQRDQMAWGFSQEETNKIQQHCTTLERIAPYEGWGLAVRGTRLTQMRDVVFVSAGYFPILGMKPLMGRTIADEDTKAGNDRVVVLSYRLWNSLFDGDRRIVGRAVLVGDAEYRVIGVMPKKFDLAADVGTAESFDGLWAPISPTSAIAVVREGRTSAMIALIKKGVSLRDVDAQLKTMSVQLAAARPGWAVKNGPNLGGLEIMRSTLKHEASVAELPALLGAVGFVLLLACVNLSALLLARGWMRQHEIAIRRTLGATRLRISRQLLAESLLIAAAGGAAGLLMSLWGIRILVAIAPAYTPRLDHVTVDGRVLAFTAAVSILAAILFGLAPAMQAASRHTGNTLSGGLGGSFAGPARRQRHGLRNLLIVSEVALAVILVTGGALMGRTLYKLVHRDTGTQPDHVLTMSVQLKGMNCDGDRKASCDLTDQSILDGIRALPGVERAALSDEPDPFMGGESILGFSYGGGPIGQGLYVEGKPGNQIPHGDLRKESVAQGYFDALGARLLKGRDFDSRDISAAMAAWAWSQSPEGQKEKEEANKNGGCGLDLDPVAIVSEGFAQKYISGNPIGKRFRTCENSGGVGWTEIIGVVNDVRDHSLQTFAPTAAFYTPLLGTDQGVLVTRTSADPMAAVPGIERVVQSVNKDVAITQIETVDQVLAESSGETRFQAMLFGSFGALGLLLAMIGIYGVISYSVAQRTHEIGVRMALGADRGDVLRMVLAQSAWLAVAGIALGLAGALGLTRFLRSMLFEVTPTDPVTFAGVAVLLLATAIAACWIPARRAMKVDPMVALRHE